MQLVFLALQVGKESAHPQKLPLAAKHEIFVFIVQIRPWRIEGNARLLGITLQIGEQRTILRLRPRLNRTFRQALDLVRNDEVEIEINRIPKPLTPRASSVGIIKRKKSWLRLLITQATVLALKPLRETEWGTDTPIRRFCLGSIPRNLKNNLPRFAISRLDRIHQAGPRFSGHNQAVD